jgi:poly(3-hydroxybutyrate) depolymerase
MKFICPLLLLLIVFTNCTKSGDNITKKAGSDLTNIQYGSNLDTSGKMVPLNMDLYFPSETNPAGKYPLVVMIHGGSYLNGDKSDVKNDCSILADSGFVVAAINYRLGWRSGNGNCNGDESSQLQAGYRALQDANAALRFLMTHAKQYGIDTGWVFIGGNSAGSSLALNTAYIPNNVAIGYLPSDYSLLGAVNNAGNDQTSTFKIKGICNMWGALPDSNLITASSALPTISFHGTNDKVVPFDIGYNESCSNYIMLFGSACIQRRLQFFGIPAISNFVIGGGHGPAVYTHEFLMSNTACFFKRVIRGTPITSKIYTTLVSSCEE